MQIGITGARGLIGRHLARLAKQRGHEVTVFSRRPREGERLFLAGQPCDCSGLDAVIHLAGEPVLGLWTRAKRLRIRESRVLGTRGVVEGLRAAASPRILVCASAVGYYGWPAEPADEEAPQGEGFLAEVCEAWEREARRAGEWGVRVACLRLGLVLGDGGALGLAAPIFRWGLGGRIGSGQQWMSAIHVEDAARMALWICENSGLAGPFNAVMPEPFRNADFTRELARAVRRPAWLPAPAFALRLLLGGLSDLFLNNSRVVPRRALEAGFKFDFPALPAALENLLAR